MKSADFWRSRQNPEFDVTLRCLIEMFGCETEHSKFALFNFYHFYTIHTQRAGYNTPAFMQLPNERAHIQKTTEGLISHSQEHKA